MAEKPVQDPKLGTPEKMSAVMSNDKTLTIDKVREIARLARIEIGDAETERLTVELNNMRQFFAALDEVDVDDIEPYVSATAPKMRNDIVIDGGDASAILANAPEFADNYFLVPQVIE